MISYKIKNNILYILQYVDLKIRQILIITISNKINISK